MDKYLVFRLYGPMASWGEIAVGEVRRSADYPSRSAILGLVSAALGIKRVETDKLSAIFSGYDIAIKVISPGTLLVDYHTVQVPDNTGNFEYMTRRDELIIGEDKLGTILTSREYRCDAISIAALRSRKNAPYSLDEIQNNLLYPKYILYLGRKSCPLAAPLQPQIVSAKGFKQALDDAKFQSLVLSHDNKDLTDRFIPISTIRYYWEGDVGDMQPQQTHERYDDPVNKQRWQFAPRKEHFFITEGGE